MYPTTPGKWRYSSSKVAQGKETHEQPAINPTDDSTADIVTLAGEAVLLVFCSTTVLFLRDSVCSALLVAIFVSYWRHCRPKAQKVVCCSVARVTGKQPRLQAVYLTFKSLELVQHASGRGFARLCRHRTAKLACKNALVLTADHPGIDAIDTRRTQLAQ